MGLAGACGWFWPFKGVVILTERPCRIRMDDDGRLDCGDGPALAYPDGCSLWRIGGVSVDEQIVMRPRTQSLDQIRSETNAEVKRIRIERFGWREYLEAAGAVVLDRRRNDVEATREALMRSPDGETVLVAACPSTAKVFALEVPPEIGTCEAAQAWLSGGLSSRVINAS
jgi:hypothetical protein